MTSRIKFKPKPKKIVDSILYLALKGIELDQYKVVKLLYLADREHFRRFGRPITFDRYVAMPFGPVASCAYDVLRGKRVKGVDADALPFERTQLDKIIIINNPKRDISRDIFSKSDLMVLDQTVEEYGNYSFKKLYDITHDHFAYSRAWENKKTNADEMRYEDFLPEDAAKEDRISDLEFSAQGM